MCRMERLPVKVQIESEVQTLQDAGAYLLLCIRRGVHKNESIAVNKKRERRKISRRICLQKNRLLMNSPVIGEAEEAGLYRACKHRLILLKTVNALLIIENGQTAPLRAVRNLALPIFEKSRRESGLLAVKSQKYWKPCVL